MFKLMQRFLREEDGQDFAEYALILGAIGVVAIAVIAHDFTDGLNTVNLMLINENKSRRAFGFLLLELALRLTRLRRLP